MDAPHVPPESDAPAQGLAAVPQLIWSPLVLAALVAIPGVIGWSTGYPLLFPSLGPTALLHAVSPRHDVSRFYNTIVGHLIGFGCAFLIVWLLGAESEPSVLSSGELLPLRLAASVLALFLLLVGQLLLHAQHPPAAASTLLITLGGFHLAWHDALILTTGVTIIALLSEPLRRLRTTP